MNQRSSADSNDSDYAYVEEETMPLQKRNRKSRQPKRIARFISDPSLHLNNINQFENNSLQYIKPILSKPEKINFKPNSNSVQPIKAIVPQIKSQPQYKSPTPQLAMQFDLSKHVPSCFDIIPRGNCPGIKMATCELFYC